MTGSAAACQLADRRKSSSPSLLPDFPRNGPENAVKSPCNTLATALQGPCTDPDPCRRFPISRCGPFNHHSPLEGESANQGRSPRIFRWGDRAVRLHETESLLAGQGRDPTAASPPMGPCPPVNPPERLNRESGSLSLSGFPPPETPSQSRFPVPEARFSRIQALERSPGVDCKRSRV